MATAPVPDAYAAVYADFRWHVPANFSWAEVCCARWARETPDALALIFESDTGSRAQYSYGQLQRAAHRLSNALRSLGVQRGDRVALLLPQRFETAVAHIAINQLGAVAMPLSLLFGPEALAYRLQDSGAVLAIVDESALVTLRGLRASCPALRQFITIGGAPQGEQELCWMAALQSQAARFTPEQLSAEDPALLIYTSGTTGAPKGALIPQRALIGNLSGFVASQNWFGFDPKQPQRPSQAVFWSPADWAWTGGLLDALLPTLYFGRPILAYQGRFVPERAFALMQRHGVTHCFLPPTALKAMMKAVPQPRAQFKRLKLEAIMSAGEALGDAVFAYCRRELGISVNEMFGQTEINYVVGNCARLWPARPGSMGRAYPGHRVAVIDEQGQICPPGVAGEVAVHRRDVHGDLDPVFFLGYWRQPEATQAKFSGDPTDSWCRTGDLACMDAEGYFWYQGRSDDMFKSAGYRIGPGEIENCLIKHPAVALAAVVPKPDAERGALVKAYVVLAPGHWESEALVAELQAFVSGRLAPYEYPKEIEFVDALPMTSTGKLQRRVLRLAEEERARGRMAQAASTQAALAYRPSVAGAAPKAKRLSALALRSRGLLSGAAQLDAQAGVAG